MSRIKGLLIDIDDTLVKFRPRASQQSTGSLMQVLRRAGGELKNLSETETDARMERVKKEIRWWCWSDFIRELELDAAQFWDYAWRIEGEYLGPAESGLRETLLALREQGLQLFVSSNNPNLGIRHKLRLAGIPAKDIDRIFTALLGATEMRQMKWERAYWDKASVATGLGKSALAVVGDSFKDDYEVPHEAGLAMTFLVDREELYHREQPGSSLTIINAIAELPGLFSGAARPILTATAEC